MKILKGGAVIWNGEQEREGKNVEEMKEKGRKWKSKRKHGAKYTSKNDA
jgi:hypothetical protein